MAALLAVLVSESMLGSHSFWCLTQQGSLPLQVITRDADSVWPKLSPAVQATVRTELLNSLKEEQSRSIAKKVGFCSGYLLW